MIISKYSDIVKGKVVGNRRKITELFISLIGIFTVLFGVICFYKYLFMDFPLGVRVVLHIVLQWLPLLVPGIFIYKNKRYIKIKPENGGKEIITGVCIAVIMSVLLTVIPILSGFREVIGYNSYTETWQFIYEFVYAVIGVALAEELLFRGYIFDRLLEIKNNRWFAIIFSSLMFGLYHVFNLDILQVIVTIIFGLFYCICREKIKSCTMISLIFAHGIYDALIVLWLAVL